ncbi:MAG: cytochrome c biogenesis protein/redoxin [Patescibacteria group bacterium]
MHMTLFLISFLSGVLTVLAPCVLPLLPIIVGGSLKGGVWRPYLIAASLMISIVVFTLLIKVSTVFIGVSPSFFPYFSGILVMGLGVVTIFPGIWTHVAEITGFERRSQEKLEASSAKSGAFAAVLTGLALGPVFSSCSPTYSLILATVLPVSFGLGVAYLTAYALGLGIILLLISIFGQQLIKKLKWSADPKGWFRRGLGVLFVLVGLAIVTGFDKQIESGSLSAGLFDITKLEQKILKSSLPTKPSMHDSTAQNSNNTQVSMTQGAPPFELAYDGKQDAPELAGLTSWIGSSPLTIAGLKGKVVLVDFWTYSCINCQRTLPYLVEWNKKYADK